MMSSSETLPFFTPENSMESINNDHSMVITTTSQEDLEKLNQVLELTEIKEAQLFEGRKSLHRSNSLEGAVKIELLQEEVSSLQEKLVSANEENNQLRLLVEEYEHTMSLIIGFFSIYNFRCTETKE